jgi:hypothetical protein
MSYETPAGRDGGGQARAHLTFSTNMISLLNIARGRGSGLLPKAEEAGDENNLTFLSY